MATLKGLQGSLPHIPPLGRPDGRNRNPPRRRAQSRSMRNWIPPRRVPRQHHGLSEHCPSMGFEERVEGQARLNLVTCQSSVNRVSTNFPPFLIHTGTVHIDGYKTRYMSWFIAWFCGRNSCGNTWWFSAWRRKTYKSMNELENVSGFVFPL